MTGWEKFWDSNLLAAVLASAVVIVGWNVSTWQSIQQERLQFEARYLIDSFRVIYSVSTSRRRMNSEESEALSRVMGDLNIFGTQAQVNLAREFSFAVATNQEARAYDLLVELRDELRTKLDFDSLKGEELLLVQFVGEPSG